MVDNSRGRGARRYKTNVKIERQKRIAEIAGINIDQPHRLSKHHATNCSQPGCVMCGNPRRVWGELTVQEKKFIGKAEYYEAMFKGTDI